MDPGARATQVGGFVFGLREPQLSTRQVRAEYTGIRTITGELMGKSKVFLHFPPVRSGPPPYPVCTECGNACGSQDLQTLAHTLLTHPSPESRPFPHPSAPSPLLFPPLVVAQRGSRFTACLLFLPLFSRILIATVSASVCVLSHSVTVRAEIPYSTGARSEVQVETGVEIKPMGHISIAPWSMRNCLRVQRADSETRGVR